MAGMKHVHKYHKRSINATSVWACALPNCTHYMPKHLEDMVPGKASICWSCGEQIILDERNMQEDMPRCYNCNPSVLSHVLEDEQPSKQ